LQAVPTLVKYANANPYPGSVDQYCEQFHSLAGRQADDWCRLVDHAPDLENRILAAVIYRSNINDYAQSMAVVAKMPSTQKLELIKMIFASRDRFTTPLRELEHSTFTFEIIADQGAWYEIKRHRMLTLTTQDFTPIFGFTMPGVIDQAGFRDEYISLMRKCSQLYTKLENVQAGIGSYVLPNAFKRRFLVTANLRSLIHLINLRSAANAHYSVRRVALRMAELIQGFMPNFAPYLFNPSNEDWSMIEKHFFAEV
jgi:thymidylate synthase ThyX